MKKTRSALLRACLLASVPIALMSQAQAQIPIVVEAETGTLGASLSTGTASGFTYITGANGTTPPTNLDRVATYSITFPAPGNYALYVRILAGPIGGNDDSFYIPSGFNVTNNWP